jgi:hypothetical protein
VKLVASQDFTSVYLSLFGEVNGGEEIPRQGPVQGDGSGKKIKDL